MMGQLVSAVGAVEKSGQRIAGQEQTAREKKKRLRQVEKRIGELDELIRKLYEGNATGKIPDKHFNRLLAEYDTEHKSTSRRGNFSRLLCGPLCLSHPAHTQLVLLPFPVPRRQRLLRFRFFLGGQNNLRFGRNETADKVEIYINRFWLPFFLRIG